MSELSANIVDKLKFAIDSENQAIDYYEQLAEQVETNEERIIINNIRNDEIEHYNKFQEILKSITNEDYEPKTENEKNMNNNNIVEYGKSTFNELAAAEFYKSMMPSFISSDVKETILSILLDEMEHAIKLNFLFCSKK